MFNTIFNIIGFSSVLLVLYLSFVGLFSKQQKIESSYYQNKYQKAIL